MGFNNFVTFLFCSVCIQTSLEGDQPQTQTTTTHHILYHHETRGKKKTCSVSGPLPDSCIYLFFCLLIIYP